MRRPETRLYITQRGTITSIRIGNLDIGLPAPLECDVGDVLVLTIEGPHLEVTTDAKPNSYWRGIDEA